MTYVDDIFTTNEETLIRTLEPIFMYKGLPTEEYKQFLLDIVQYVVDADSETRQIILQFLMRCEEPTYVPITGIIHIKLEDPQFFSYTRIVRAIYGEYCSFVTTKQADICNTIVVNMIQQLESGCKYHPCYRVNKMHKQYMHHRLQF
jgi:hypothetical protein